MMRNSIFAAATAVATWACMVGTAEARPHDDDASPQEITSHQFTHGVARESQRSVEKRGKYRASRTAHRGVEKLRKHRASRTAARRERARRSYEEVSYSSSSGHGVGPRPRRWCGWWMRTQRGGGPHLNLARNWAGWGSPASPQVGAVVVWRGHVGEIVGRADNGKWIVRSGNDGGRVRSRARSLAGVIAVRM